MPATATTTPSLKLTYYDLDGRAALIRKTFAMGGVPFVDERLTRDEFQQLKASLPYQKIPVLTIDGEIVAETHAILRYAGRLTGMYPPPSEPLAAALVDEIIDSSDDLFERLLFPSMLERDAEKKKQMREALMDGPLPHAMGLLDRRLAQIQQYPFFANDPARVYLHELVAWDYVAFLRSGIMEHIPTTFMDDFKTMVAIFDKVEKLPSVNQRGLHSTKETPTPPKMLALTYFDMPGRAEQIRLALTIGGVDFEDDRISFEDMSSRKSEFPNAQVPVLRVNDTTVLAQSVAVLRYVGSFTGLYPVNDALAAAQIDEVLSHIGELYFTLDPSFMESDPSKKKAMREQLASSTIPESLDTLDKRLASWKRQAASKSPYAMGGEALTIADLGVYSLVMFLKSGFLDHVPTTIVDKYTEILTASEAVVKLPQVAQWYAKQHVPTA